MADHEREPPDEIRAAVERAREELRRELAGEAERIDRRAGRARKRMNESAARVAESRVEREMERLERASAALSSELRRRLGEGAEQFARRTRRAARGERRRTAGREPTLAARAVGSDPGRGRTRPQRRAARGRGADLASGSRSASIETDATLRWRLDEAVSNARRQVEAADRRASGAGGARSADGDRRRPYGASRADHDTHHRRGRSPRRSRRPRVSGGSLESSRPRSRRRGRPASWSWRRSYRP